MYLVRNQAPLWHVQASAGSLHHHAPLCEEMCLPLRPPLLLHIRISSAVDAHAFLREGSGQSADPKIGSSPTLPVVCKILTFRAQLSSSLQFGSVFKKPNNQDTYLCRPCSSVPPAPFQALAFYAWTRSCSLRRLPSVASTWVERMLKGGLTDNCAPSTRGFLGYSSRRKGIFRRKFMAAPPRPVGKALAQNCTFLAPS